MGQKSNTLTLKKHHNNLNFSSVNSKQLLLGLKFKHLFERLLFCKDVWVLESTWNFCANKLFLNMSLFFRSTKVKNYKKKSSVKQSSISKKLFNDNFLNLFNANLNNLKINLIFLNIKIINKDINPKLLLSAFNENKRFANLLFARRFNFFVDFLKVCCLFIQGSTSSKPLLVVFAQIFKILPKRNHARFFIFVNHLFQFIIAQKQSNIIGLKLIVNGKIRGKTRSDSKCVQVGQVSLQSIDQKIDLSFLHAYTIYGAFGLKFYVCYK